MRVSETQIFSYLKARAITETSATLEIRARSYLDANCAQCHLPGGVRASFDARFTTPLAQQNLIYGQPFDTINGPTDRYIRPKELAHSLTYERASRVGALQMPPLAKNVTDAAAMQVIAAWIDSLNPAPAVVVSRTPATCSTLTRWALLRRRHRRRAHLFPRAQRHANLRTFRTDHPARRLYRVGRPHHGLASDRRSGGGRRS